MANIKNIQEIKDKFGRVKVEGMYITPSVYTLFDSDGEEFLTIRENEEFEVAGRTWIANRVPNKTGLGTVLLCSNWEDTKIFHLLHKKKGTWATTVDEAKKGIFLYPRNAVEEILFDKEYNQKVMYADDITCKVTIGGKVKVGRSNLPYLYLATDGQITALPHKKTDVFYDVKVTGATYVVETFRNNENGIVHPKRVMLQKNTDYGVAAKVLENLGTKWPDLK